ncbi:MAG: DNA-directed RNA polymerase subunit beta [Spirochaetia bacterium]|nr:DNA-directed RNA polymerase subunit beta [Spirochaetia bacterium]
MVRKAKHRRQGRRRRPQGRTKSAAWGEWFLQPDAQPAKRKHQGLEAVYRETFPIESPNEDMVLEYVSYELGTPRWDVEECKNRGATFAVPLKATIRLINKHTGEVREQSVYIGDLPLMTEQGTFIINGAERVVVSQLHRSPGIFFFYDVEKRIYSARVIPYRGSWLELEMDSKGILVARIDRKKKFPSTLLLKAMGFGSNEEVLKLFYQTETIQIAGANARDLKKMIGRRFAAAVLNPESDETIIDAGEKVNEDNLDILKELKIKKVALLVFPGGKDDVTVINCLEKDGVETQDAATL